MTRGTIEATFEYNIEQAAKEYVKQFDSVEDALKDLRRNVLPLAQILFDRAEVWNGSFEELIKEKFS